MGNASPVSQLSVEEVANLVAGIGEAYQSYRRIVIQEGIDGDILESFPQDESSFKDLLRKWGISNDLHLSGLYRKYTKLMANNSLPVPQATTPPPAISTPPLTISTTPPPVTTLPPPPPSPLISSPTPPLISKFSTESSGFFDSAKINPSMRYHAFLTHNWGHDQSNHLRVSKINKYLQSKGVITWFDEERMEGKIRRTMTEGIDNSDCVVVFITQVYYDKVNGDDQRDNCQFEYSYATRRLGPQRMIPVVMEPSMRDSNSWKGEIGGDLGGLLYVDMSSNDETIFYSKCDELISRIISIQAQLTPSTALKSTAVSSFKLMKIGSPETSDRKNVIPRLGLEQKEQPRFLSASLLQESPSKKSLLTVDAPKTGVLPSVARPAPLERKSNKPSTQQFSIDTERMTKEEIYKFAVQCYEGRGDSGGQGDFEEAARLFRIAADKGSHPAITSLGICYENGHGVPQDRNKAIRFYLLAIDKGNVDAMFRLGEIYEKDAETVPQKMNDAVKYYRLAAKNGNEIAVDRLKKIDQRCIIA